VPPATWPEVRALIAGTLMPVVLVNALVAWVMPNHSPDRGARVSRTKWHLVERAPAGTDWLILGDSSALRGVDPQLLDRRLGTRSINLGTTRRMLVTGDAWLLSEFIRRRGPPKGVLLVHVHEVWHGDRSWLVSSLSDIPKPWGFWARMDPPLPLAPGEQWRVFLSRYVPLYADNQSLAVTLQYPWKFIRYFSSIGMEPNGYMPVDRTNAGEVDQDLRRNLDDTRGRRFEISAINLEALGRILALAEQHGFEVYLANSPVYQALYDAPEFRAYFRQVQAALRALDAAEPRLRYIAQEPSTFPKEQMENCDHVTSEASPAYTNRLADEILALQGRTGP
jgi:hypothetical protein